ncbi:MAG: hypothetical protein AAF682_27385 [Planctomycetota bacterium]
MSEPDETLRRRLVEPEGRAAAEDALAGDPELARAAAEQDEVLHALERAGEAERERLLERGDEIVARPPREGPPRLWWVAAAALVATVLFAALRGDDATEEKEGPVYLSGSGDALLQPAGDGASFEEFAWEATDTGGGFELRVWHLSDGPDQPPRLVRTPAASPWRPTSDDLRELGDEIRWELIVLDVFGEPGERFSAQARRSP